MSENESLKIAMKAAGNWPDAYFALNDDGIQAAVVFGGPAQADPGIYELYMALDGALIGADNIETLEYVVQSVLEDGVFDSISTLALVTNDEGTVTTARYIVEVEVGKDVPRAVWANYMAAIARLVWPFVIYLRAESALDQALDGTVHL